MPIADLDAGHKAFARTLVERIVATCATDDAAYALACIEANGGVGGMSLSYYARGEDGEIPDAQVFRLEGPSAVLYFRGSPPRARLHQHRNGRRLAALIR